MKGIISSLIFIILIWISATSMVYRFRHPKLTETELFLAIPKSMLLK
jgi:hypothetical protein